MIRKIFWTVCILGLFTFCTSEKEKGVAVIKGTFSEFSGEWLYLDELEVRTTIPVDSVKLDKEGYFQFEIVLEDAGFYLLKTNPENVLLLLIENDEVVELHSKNRDFFNGYSVSGSPGSQLMEEYNDFMHLQKSRIDSLGKIYNESKSNEGFMEIKNELDSVYLSIVEDQKQYIRNFINQNPGSLASLIVLNRKLGMNEIIDEEEDFSLLFRIDSMLKLKYPGNKHVVDHSKRVKEIQTRIFDNYLAEQKLKPGKKAPDIVLPDTAGNIVSLKSYTGNPVIVYFWAGWSAKARQDNQKLIKLYPEIKASGLDILGVSLDENEVVWKGAVRLDKLPWKQVSDLQGMFSPVKSDFNIPDELPFYYLLDEDLKILTKNNELDSILINLETLSLSN